jgi:hypothetical protein
MDLTRHHLAPIFENIINLLGATSGQLELFEPWAQEQSLRLRRAAEHGKPSLSYEAELLRDELHHMLTPVDLERMLTERTERMRLCQRMWLTGLIDFVDDLLDDQVPAQLARAA